MGMEDLCWDVEKVARDLTQNLCLDSSLLTSNNGQ